MADHYTYRVTWSAEDGEHLGLCAEFPSRQPVVKPRVAPRRAGRPADKA